MTPFLIEHIAAWTLVLALCCLRRLCASVALRHGIALSAFMLAVALYVFARLTILYYAIAP